MEKSSELVTRVAVQLNTKMSFMEFGLSEMKSIILAYGGDLGTCFAPEYSRNGLEVPKEEHMINFKSLRNFPMLELDLPQKIIDKVDEIMSRSVMIKKIVKLYGVGATYEEVLESIDVDGFQHELDSKKTYAFCVGGIAKSIKTKEQLERMAKFDRFVLKGKCNLKKPERVFQLIEDYNILDNRDFRDLRRIYFGLELSNSYKQGQAWYSKYCLPDRVYLGPTSTDHELAFLMANQAKVLKNDLVIDPFAGTGSLLIAASVFGAFCFGTEIDVRVIKGYSVGRKNHLSKAANKYKKVNIFTNFIEYGLEMPEIMRMDTTVDLFKDQLNFFDAIICDPPYGYRAAVRESGLKNRGKERKRIREEEGVPEKTEEEKDQLMSLVPTKTSQVQKMVEGLFELSNRILKVGGRLVYLYPRENPKDSEYYDSLPKNECFKLIEASNNPIAAGKSRILITMEKIK